MWMIKRCKFLEKVLLGFFVKKGREKLIMMKEYRAN
jgi:hypothetical protein